MNKTRIFKLTLLLVLILGSLYLLSFVLSQKNEPTGFKIEDKYGLSDSPDNDNLSYVYKLSYNDTVINIMTTVQVDNSQLNSGWMSEKITTISTKNEFNSDNLFIYDNSLVYFEDSQNIYINYLADGTTKKLDITENHPQIINLAQNNNELILLIKANEESNQDIKLIERNINIETLAYKDSLLSFKLSDKLSNNLINNLTGSSTGSDIQIEEVNISGRALDVWEFNTDFSGNPIVYSSSNGDYIVSDPKMKEVGVITFNGDFKLAFKDAPEYWILGN